MIPSRRTGVAALAAVIALLVLLVVAPSAARAVQGAGAKPPPDPEQDGVRNLADCYASSRSLAMVMVVDESASLRRTDPDGERVGLARAINEAMTVVAGARTTGTPGRIDLAVATFGTDYRPFVDWTSLDRAAGDRVAGRLPELGDRNGDQDTDYVTALDRARAALIERSAVIAPSDPSSVCRAIVWFTDGKLDFEPSERRAPWAQDLPLRDESDVRRLVERGRSVLCEPGGLADQLRAGELYLFTASFLSRGFDLRDEALLRGVTLGDGCGDLPGGPTATLFSSDDMERIVSEFLLALVGPDPPDGSRPCPAGAPCEVGFGLDNSVVSAVVVATGTPPGGSLELVAPTGEAVDLGPASVDTSLAGVALTSRAALSSRVATLTPEPADSRWVGTWRVRFSPPADGSLQVNVTRRHDVSLRPVGRPTLQRGSTGTAEFELVNGAGTVLDPTVWPGAELAATVVQGGRSSAAPVRPGGAPGRWAVDVTPPTDLPAGVAAISVTGAAVNASGSREPVAASVEATVAVPGAPTAGEVRVGVLRPEVEPVPDRPGQFRAAPVAAEGAVPLSADPTSPGRVCVVGATGAARVVAVGERCVDLAAGEAGRLPVRVEVARPRPGPLQGAVQLEVASRGGDPASLQVPLGGEVVVPLPPPYTDTGDVARWVLPVLLALVVLWLAMSWWGAGFTSPELVKGYDLPVVLRPATIEAERPPLDAESWRFLEPDRRRRAHLGELVLTAPVRILRPQDAIASFPGRVAHGPWGGAGGLRRDDGRMAHQLHGQWVFTAERQTVQDDGGIAGTLHVLLSREALSGEADPASTLDRAFDEARLMYDAIRARLHVDAPPGTAEVVRSGAEGGGTGGAPDRPERFSNREM